MKTRSHLNDVAPTNAPVEGRRVLLGEVRTAIRLGCYEQAQLMLVSNIFPESRAESLNLLGLTYEGQRKWKLARRHYGKALWADRRYEPAQQNMRRLYELYTFGSSKILMALGDERPALAMLLRLADSLASQEEQVKQQQ